MSAQEQVAPPAAPDVWRPRRRPFPAGERQDSAIQHIGAVVEDVERKLDGMSEIVHALPPAVGQAFSSITAGVQSAFAQLGQALTQLLETRLACADCAAQHHEQLAKGAAPEEARPINAANVMAEGKSLCWEHVQFGPRRPPGMTPGGIWLDISAPIPMPPRG